MRRTIGRLASVTYGHMATMPRLPVPPLAQTCDLYLRSIRPLATEEQLATSRALVADFQKEGGLGQRLHGLLKERAAKEHNWLERWWDNSYLDIRTSSVCALIGDLRAWGAGHWARAMCGLSCRSPRVWLCVVFRVCS